NPYGVVVSKYNGFLFEKILPQILFALLLLVITSVAFLFSFRSLRNQLRLAAIKDDFISNMSHELKTPVATMRVAIEAMQHMDPAEKKEMMRDYLGMTAEELSRLDQLISKVMSSIAMENGNNIFHLEQVNLKSLIEKTIQSMELQLKQRNTEVKFVCNENEVIIRADAVHVQGILSNLFDNSLKYGNDSPEIFIHLSKTVSDVVLIFKDNGPGIPEEYLAKVFEKFFRVPSGNQHNVKGFGLGLSYVAQVMKQHGGSVEVKNLAGRGCEFTLKFPKA
ncbi:MAG: sensor histidine kinase, partial [Chitinophagales bacterium]